MVQGEFIDMSKGTILYVGGFELPDKNAAAHRVMANAKIFAKLGYSTVFIGIDRSMKFEKNFTIKKKEFNGFIYWNILYPKTNKEWIKYLTSIDTFLKVATKYNDIRTVICYNYPSIAFARIIKYCRKKNIKIISDCTEWYGKVEGNIVFQLLKYLDTTLRMKVINRKVDSLIVVSDYLRSYYKEKNTIVIPTLVDMKNKEPVYADNKVTKLIYAGVPFRLGKPLKNRSLMKDRLDIAIKLLYIAYKKGIKFVFDIYGITKEQYLKVLPNDAFIIDTLENYIIFNGRRSSEEIQNALRCADFSLLIREDNRTTKAGFPTKFTESIKCGVPVITTKTSDLHKYLVEGKNGFFIDINNDNLDIEKFMFFARTFYKKLQVIFP
jgi:glycosyltransferase involved in cell wall biosynthesis